MLSATSSSRSASKPPEVAFSLLQMLVDSSMVTFERYVLTAALRSLRFYRDHRNQICPFHPNTGRWRPDFSTSRFNAIYQHADQIWRLYDTIVVQQDMEIPQEHLEAILIDSANQGRIPGEVIQEILQDLKQDLYANAAPTPAFLDALGGEALQYWIDLRISTQTVARISAKAASENITLDVLESTLVRARMDAQAGVSRSVAGHDVLRGTRLLKGKLRSGLPDLDSALGGGYAWGETTMVAGMNGGGKTVLAVQAAVNAIMQGRRVAFITTEEPPHKLITRMVQNYCKMPARRLEAGLVVDDGNKAGLLTNLIPVQLWADPLYGGMLMMLDAMMSNFLWIIDWTQESHSMVSEFDNEISKLKAAAFDSEVIIMDWVGGALEKDKDVDRRRLLYEESVNHLVNHGKRHNTINFVMAQLDKVKAARKKRPTMDMLSECKTMSNNIHNWIGISSLTETNHDQEVFSTRPRLLPFQILNVDKCRDGPAGPVKVRIMFNEQRIDARPFSI